MDEAGREALFCHDVLEQCLGECSGKTCNREKVEICLLTHRDCLNNPAKYGLSPVQDNLESKCAGAEISFSCILRNIIFTYDLGFILGMVTVFLFLFNPLYLLSHHAELVGQYAGTVEQAYKFVSSYKGFTALSLLLAVPYAYKICQSKLVFGQLMNPTYVPGRRFQCLYYLCYDPNETPPECYKPKPGEESEEEEGEEHSGLSIQSKSLLLTAGVISTSLAILFSAIILGFHDYHKLVQWTITLTIIFIIIYFAKITIDLIIEEAPK